MYLFQLYRLRLQETVVNFLMIFRPADIQQIIISLKGRRVGGKFFRPISLFIKTVLLYHRAHCAIKHQHSFFQYFMYMVFDRSFNIVLLWPDVIFF
jgi:hypothetical protein